MGCYRYEPGKSLAFALCSSNVPISEEYYSDIVAIVPYVGYNMV